jgi:hypothetical protein
MSRVIIQKSQQYFSESEKHLVIEDYLASKLSKQFFPSATFLHKQIRVVIF